jgi:hypothetical protein
VPLEGLPYVERPVIAAQVLEGSDSLHLSVTRTLPTTAAYDPSAAAVTDAAVTVRTGGTAYPAVHQGNGRYSAAGFRIAAGATFDLDVTWNGHAVTAQTFIPAPARVGGSTLTQASSGSTLRSAIVPRSGETYCQGWAIRGLMQSMNGEPVSMVLVSVLAMLGWSIAFFVVGVLRFNRRYL